MVDARLSGDKREMSVVTVPFLTASLLGQLFSNMIRVVDCHAGILDSNPGGPKIFSLCNYFSHKPLQASSSESMIGL